MTRHLTMLISLAPAFPGYDWRVTFSHNHTIEGHAPTGREALREAMQAALDHGPGLLGEEAIPSHHARLVKTLGTDE